MSFDWVVHQTAPLSWSKLTGGQGLGRSSNHYAPTSNSSMSFKRNFPGIADRAKKLGASQKIPPGHYLVR